jgi:hypothetical protein
VEERVPASEVIWEVAPELKYQSDCWGWLRDTVLKAEARLCWSQPGTEVYCPAACTACWCAKRAWCCARAAGLA